MQDEQTEPLDEGRPDVAAEHVETQHGPDGTQVLIFRVTAAATPGRVTWDIAQAEPVKRCLEDFPTIAGARRKAREWIAEAQREEATR